MEIKLVAIDLDDTLLNSGQEIGSENYKAVQAVKEKGVMVVLATGRMFRSAAIFADKLKLDMPIIAYQGAWVKRAGDDKPLYCRNMEQAAALDVMQFLTESKIYFHIYSDDKLYVNTITDEVDFYIAAGIEPVEVGELCSFARGREIIEIMAAAEENKLMEITENLKEKFGDTLYISRLKNRYIEIMHKKANKAAALEMICGHYGIERDQVMAIGDGYNDIPMLKWAGIGVAMGNAPAEVKKAADLVTLSHDEQGVAYILHKWIINR